MSNKGCQQLQSTASEYLVRHRSILDVMSKFQDSSAHINRSIVKAVTTCGCLEIDASKQSIPDNITLSEISNYVQTHLKGTLCPNCVEVLENELGAALFYLAGICNLLGLNMDSIISKENERLETLGVYSLM
ncbi:MAG: DUF1573 domain-containing protein [Actinomycetota bacterium]|nr:DUF1573 domain-containing protein [Actinomycetota bacterium]